MRTLLGLLATGALITGCSREASPDGTGGTRPASVVTALPASLPSPTPSVVVDVPAPTPAPVDPVAVATAGPPDAYRSYLLGLALWKSGQAASAEAALVESAKLDATRLKTWINLARVRHDLDNRGGALEAAEAALGLDPSSADALHQKGRALMELGRADEALATLRSGREIDPENGYLANTLGLLLIQLGRPSEAIEPLEIARTTLPAVAYVRNNLGVAYERTGRTEDAKLEYVAAVVAGDTGGKAARSLARLGVPGTTEPADSAVAVASVPVQ